MFVMYFEGDNIDVGMLGWWLGSWFICACCCSLPLSMSLRLLKYSHPLHVRCLFSKVRELLPIDLSPLFLCLAYGVHCKRKGGKWTIERELDEELDEWRMNYIQINEAEHRKDGREARRHMKMINLKNKQ